MLTNYFTDKEQLQFEILESKKFPIYKQSVIILVVAAVNCLMNIYCQILLR